MLPHFSPNRWSCLPTAFAILAGIPVKELIDAIGHDGSEIVASNEPEPYCRRTFHIQEIVDVLWEKGFTVTTFERYPTLLIRAGMEPRSVNDYQVGDSRIKNAIQGQKAVLSGFSAAGHRHAVAYDSGTIFCPSQGTISEKDFTTYVAYVLIAKK